MKAIKLSIIALILACSFQAANAQVSVGVRIGTPPPPHRVVVVERPVYHPRPVVIERYPAPRYRQVVYYRNGHRYYSQRPVVYHRPVVIHHRRW